MNRTSVAAILLHLAVGLSTAVAYAVASPPRPARLASYRGIIAILGGWAYWVTRPMLAGAQAVGLTANGLTAIGVVLNCGAGVAAGFGEWGWAALLIVWGSIGDLLDGELARNTGTVSPAGAFLDSNLDRVSEVALLAGFAVAFPDRAGVFWAVSALSASLLVSYARARGEGLGVSCPNFGLERPHRVVILMASLLVAAFLRAEDAILLLEAVSALIAVTAGATAAARMVVIHGLLRRAETPRAEPEGPPGGAAR